MKRLSEARLHLLPVTARNSGTIVLTMLQLLTATGFSQNYSISGSVHDGDNGETVVGATALLKGTTIAAATNAYGFFSLSAPAGTHTLVVQSIGYATYSTVISVDRNFTKKITLKPAATELDEVEISTQRQDENVTSTRMGVVQLDMAEIKKVPAFMREVDILKTIQLLPGIKNAGDGNTGFYVRGGGPDQNLILLDEATIYNASHLLGFFSVFNGDAIKNVTLHKGNMPAEYGGRLSSVLDISMKEGNNQRVQVDGGIGVIASRLTVQGPIVKDKSSFIISGRRTYVDVIAKPWIDKSDFKGTAYHFYDLNAKVNYVLGEKDRIFLSGYLGRDKFHYSDGENGFETDIPWGNASACLRWNHVYNPKLFSNLSAVYTNYDFSFGASQEEFVATIQSGISDYNLKYDLSYYPGARHNLKAGLNYIYHVFVPTNVSARQGETNFDLGRVKLYAHELAAYVGDEWDASPRLKVNAGIRFGNFAQVGPFNRYIKDAFGKISDTVRYGQNDVVAYYNGLEPRLSARYSLGNDMSLKASYARNFQYIHLATISSISLPTDVWMPCTEVIKPQESNQVAAGLFRNFSENMFEASVEGYYKTMSNQVEFKEGAQPADNVFDNPDNAFTFGRGWAYGAEFFLKKNRGKFTGWIGYTLSWTWRNFPAINYGLDFLAKYDRRHDASIVLNYDHSRQWNFGLVWVYGSGNRGTLPNGFFLYEGSLSNDYGLRNSYQFVPYHRMDLNVTFSPNREKRLERKRAAIIRDRAANGLDTADTEVTKKWMRHYHSSFTFSLFNAYNRYNPYFIYLTREGDFINGSLKVGARQVSLFPIIPSLTWNFKF